MSAFTASLPRLYLGQSKEYSVVEPSGILHVYCRPYLRWNPLLGAWHEGIVGDTRTFESARCTNFFIAYRGFLTLQARTMLVLNSTVQEPLPQKIVDAIARATPPDAELQVIARLCDAYGVPIDMCIKTEVIYGLPHTMWMALRGIPTAGILKIRLAHQQRLMSMARPVVQAYLQQRAGHQPLCEEMILNDVVCGYANGLQRLPMMVLAALRNHMQMHLVLQSVPGLVVVQAVDVPHETVLGLVRFIAGRFGGSTEEYEAALPDACEILQRPFVDESRFDELTVQEC